MFRTANRESMQLNPKAKAIVFTTLWLALFAAAMRRSPGPGLAAAGGRGRAGPGWLAATALLACWWVHGEGAWKIASRLAGGR